MTLGKKYDQQYYAFVHAWQQSAKWTKEVSAATEWLHQAGYRGGRVLDVGCGLGRTSQFLSGEYVGIEPDSEVARAARALYESERVSFLSADAHELPFANESFSLVYAAHLIAHLREPERFVAEVRRVLQPGGLFLVIVPNWYFAMGVLRPLRWLRWISPKFDRIDPTVTRPLTRRGLRTLVPLEPIEIRGWFAPGGSVGHYSVWATDWHALFRKP